VKASTAKALRREQGRFNLAQSAVGHQSSGALAKFLRQTGQKVVNFEDPTVCHYCVPSTAAARHFAVLFIGLARKARELPRPSDVSPRTAEFKSLQITRQAAPLLPASSHSNCPDMAADRIRDAPNGKRSRAERRQMLTRTHTPARTQPGCVRIRTGGTPGVLGAGSPSRDCAG
jgi:hypothetical protein